MQVKVQGLVEQKTWQNTCFEGSLKVELENGEEKSFTFRLLYPLEEACIMIWDENGEMFAEFASEVALNRVEFGDEYEWEQKAILYLIAEMMGNFLFGGVRINSIQREIPIDNVYEIKIRSSQEVVLCAT